MLLLARARAPQPYPDFVVGSLAWHQGTKLQDLLAGPVAVAVFLLLARWHRQLQDILRKHQGVAAAQGYSVQLLWWSVPAAGACAAVLMASPLEPALVLLSSFGTTMLAASTSQQLKRHEPADPERTTLALVAGLLLGVWPIAGAALVGRIHPASAGLAEAMLGWVRPAFIAGALAGAALAMVPGRAATLRWALPIAQCALPLLLLGLWPPQLAAPDGTRSGYPMQAGLPLLVGGLVLVGLADTLLRWRRAFRADPGASPGAMLSPWAFLALLVALRLGGASAPQVSTDDYHFGERLLGVMAYASGALPYVDHLPPHGLVEDDLGAWLSRLFLDGLGGTAIEGARLGTALLGAAAFFALRHATGSMMLAFAAVALIGVRTAWLLLVPFLCLWCAPALLARPGRWLLAWAVTAPLLVLAAPPFGVVATLAALPCAAAMAWRWWRQGTPRQRGAVLASVVLLLLLLAGSTPLLRMLVAAVQYVVENGAVNQTAYGIPWAFSWAAPAPSGLLFEAVRMSWLAVLAWCVASAWRSWQARRSHPGAAAAWWPAAIAALLLLLLIPYAMGRIDPSSLSRPGQVAGLAWIFLLPLAAWAAWTAEQRAAAAVLVVAMASAVNPAPIHLATLVSAAVPVIAAGPARDGRAAGLPGLGRTLVDDAQWERLSRVQAALSERLAPGEPYLDLTNRNAQHAYLGRPAVVAVSAPYNMASPSQQRRDLARLAARPPRMALLEADNIVHDGGGLALRTPQVYRHVVEHYAPRLSQGLVVADFIGAGNAAPTDARADAPTDSQLAERAALFERAFARHDLAGIPQSWGRSEASLRPRMTPVQSLDTATMQARDLQPVGPGRYRFAGPVPALTVDASPLAVDGARSGLLRLDWHCASGAPGARIALEWWGTLGTDSQRPASVGFSAASGTLIVPLDAQPRWLLMRRVQAIRLNLAGAKDCAEVAIGGLSLLQRQ